MDQELCRKFNDAIHRHQKALTYYADTCDWKNFETNAGEMFDLAEAVELSVLEEKFFRITKIVVALVLVLVALIFRMNPAAYPGMERINELLTLLAIALCCFEVYFLYNFRIYKKAKHVYYDRRRAKFIREIEKDFKDRDVPLDVQEAASAVTA